MENTPYVAVLCVGRPEFEHAIRCIFPGGMLRVPPADFHMINPNTDFEQLKGLTNIVVIEADGWSTVTNYNKRKIYEVLAYLEAIGRVKWYIKVKDTYRRFYEATNGKATE